MGKGYRPSVFNQASRDRNESKITAILERFHVPYVLQPPQAGFDILVFTSPLECWEVKNPEYKWSLTKAEKERMDYCKRNGIEYRIIEMIDQAADALSNSLSKKGTTK